MIKQKIKKWWYILTFKWWFWYALLFGTLTIIWLLAVCYVALK